MFKTRGGGVNGFLNNVQKNYRFGGRCHPLLQEFIKLAQFDRAVNICLKVLIQVKEMTFCNSDTEQHYIALQSIELIGLYRLIPPHPPRPPDPP